MSRATVITGAADRHRPPVRPVPGLDLRVYQPYLDRNEEAARGMTLPGMTPEVQVVADEIVRVVSSPGQSQFRTTVDFTRVGDIAVNRTAAESRRQFMERYGMPDLLPTGPAVVNGFALATSNHPARKDS
jgi:hypothetical protein